MAESVERPILGFCSGHDLRVTGLSPTLGSMVGRKLLRILSLPLLLSAVFLKSVNKSLKKKVLGSREQERTVVPCEPYLKRGIKV